MNTKIIAAAAILLASASGAFASESFDVDINRPVVSQGSQAYAQAPTVRQVAQPQANTASNDKAYTGHGSQID